MAALAFLLYLSGFFSSSETALTSVSKHHLKKHVKKGDPMNYLHWSNRMLTTILVSNNIVNILASSIATILVLELLGPENEGLAAAIATTVMTLLILIFGEITPKIYARENTERVFKRTIPVIKGLAVIFGPVIKVLMIISNFFIKLGGGKTVEDTPFVTEEDILGAVDVGQETGSIDKEEGMVVKRTFEMRKTAVKEIMTPRVDIVAIEESDTLKELMETVDEEEYSRIPVYRETIDDIVGFCYAKDVLSIIYEKGCDTAFKIKVKDIMRPPMFVPETMKIWDLFMEFKERKVHMAIVVDEFGGTAGLVTLEDVIEELIGEIYDEYDQGETVGIKKVKDGVYLVDASTPINDIERELSIKLPETEYETLGGYLLELFQRIPQTGEEITVGNFHFKIVASGKSKIEKVLMRVINDGEVQQTDSSSD
ncbi:MAG: HlyC/CorC family transporter [Thermotogaceae bacterium]|nr:HlyC/CorC family transporter [Thermotogaceae bacterium]